MGWKDLSSWLKGILWAAGIFVLIFVLSLLINRANGCNFESPFFVFCFMFNVFLNLPLLIPLLILGNGSFLETLLESGRVYSFVVQLIFYVIIGALIGWIVGKNKKGVKK